MPGALFARDADAVTRYGVIWADILNMNAGENGHSHANFVITHLHKNQVYSDTLFQYINLIHILY